LHDRDRADEVVEIVVIDEIDEHRDYGLRHEAVGAKNDAPACEPGG
jgi:hypothetical protein